MPLHNPGQALDTRHRYGVRSESTTRVQTRFCLAVFLPVRDPGQAPLRPSCPVSLVSRSLDQFLSRILSPHDLDILKSGRSYFAERPCLTGPARLCSPTPPPPSPPPRYTLQSLPTSWPRGERGTTSSPPRPLGTMRPPLRLVAAHVRGTPGDGVLLSPIREPLKAVPKGDHRHLQAGPRLGSQSPLAPFPTLCQEETPQCSPDPTAPSWGSPTPSHHSTRRSSRPPRVGPVETAPGCSERAQRQRGREEEVVAVGHCGCRTRTSPSGSPLAGHVTDGGPAAPCTLRAALWFILALVRPAGGHILQGSPCREPGWAQGQGTRAAGGPCVLAAGAPGRQGGVPLQRATSLCGHFLPCMGSQWPRRQGCGGGGWGVGARHSQALQESGGRNVPSSVSCLLRGGCLGPDCGFFPAGWPGLPPYVHPPGLLPQSFHIPVSPECA